HTVPVAGKSRRAPPPTPPRLPPPPQGGEATDNFWDTSLLAHPPPAPQFPFYTPPFNKILSRAKQNTPSGRGGPREKVRLEEEEAQTGGADDCLCTALRTQFAENGVDVEFDSVLADVQAVGNGLIGKTFGKELQDFQFTGC